MTIPIPDHLKDLPEITAEEIRKMIANGEVRIGKKTIRGEALRALHEAFSKGIPIAVEVSFIDGDLNFSAARKVPIGHVELLPHWKRKELEEQGVTELPVIEAPLVLFSGNYIMGSVNAWRVVFSCEVHFLVSRFCSEAFFMDTTFGSAANFLNVTFGDRALFGDSIFLGWALFASTTFNDYASFAGATFAEQATFAGGTFKGSLIFLGQRVLKDKEGKVVRKRHPVFEGEVDFRSMVFEVPDNVQFQHLNLSKACFLNTPLERVRFIDVDWYKPEENGRRALYDEKFTNEEGYEPVRQLYLQIKKNLEETRDYPGAGDFHYGEMEMTLKQQGKEWREESKVWPKCKKCFAWFLTASYKFLSGYGEKVDRAFVIALIILLVGLPFYFFDKLMAYQHLGYWGASWDSLIASLGYMTFRLSVPPTAWWAKPVMAFQATLGPIQLALAALALRRKFRR